MELAVTALLLLTPQADIDRILEKADVLLEEAKAGYEKARSTSSVPAFVDAGFKLEEARIKYLVIQEIGTPEKQKVAGDRLRAVNQLNKLLNDGKVAVMNPPVPKPAAPADPGAPAPAPPAERKAVDVTKRAAVPDAAKRKEAERLAHDLFKEKYAKKAPAERKAFARELFEQAGKSTDDPAACWVLYCEAEDIALQAGDVETAVEAVERRAELFDVDLLQLRGAVLSSAAKTAKSVEELVAIAEAWLRHLDELVRADQYEHADKAATAAAGHAKKTGDAALAARASTRAKEVGEMKSLFQAQKGVLEKLAKDSEDPGANLEMGKFLCFVKGAWDLGLRFLVKGSDAALKALAEKELAFPETTAERVALADGWFDLGEKDKSPLRRSQLLGRARTIYEAALPGAMGLVRTKIEKRLADLTMSDVPGVSKGAVNLMGLIDPVKDAVAGTWKLERGELRGGGAERARIQIPYLPPEEYDLTVVAEQISGTANLLFGLGRGSTRWVVIYDNLTNGKFISGLDLVDGKFAWENPTSTPGKFLKKGTVQTFEFKVRNSGVTTLVDGKKVLSWQDYSRLSMAPRFALRDKDALVFGMFDGEARLVKATLLPISGQGKPLR